MASLLLDTDLLRAYVAVVEHRSFTRAAGALHRTQSAVSMQIARLEGALGVALLQRRPEGVQTTEAGARLLGHARRMLALNDEAVADVAATRAGAPLRIGAMEDYATGVLQPALAALAAHAVPPIEVVTGLTSTMLPRLGADFDLVIAMHPAGQGSGALIRREQPVWAAGPGFAAAPHDGHAPLPLALYPEGCLLRAWAIQALDAAGRAWRLDFVGQSHGAVQAAAAQGRALTVVKADLFPRGLRRVAARHRMPPLPAADVRLHRAPRLSRSAAAYADRLYARLAAPAG